MSRSRLRLRPNWVGSGSKQKSGSRRLRLSAPTNKNISSGVTLKVAALAPQCNKGLQKALNKQSVYRSRPDSRTMDWLRRKFDEDFDENFDENLTRILTKILTKNFDENFDKSLNENFHGLFYTFSRPLLNVLKPILTSIIERF